MYQPNLEEEKKEILNKYRRVLYSLGIHKKLTEKERDTIKKSFRLAVNAHKDMRRKSGEPYIYHPLEVAYICVAEIGLGVTSVVCALLHDVVEDTDYTLEDIRTLFGDKVADITDGLTKVSTILNTDTNLNTDAKSITSANIYKIVAALVKDARVILIKLADRLHNMRTLSSLPEQKQLKITSETTLLFIPLAHRLGLYSIKSEMEDLVLKYRNPSVYEDINNKLTRLIEEHAPDIHKFIYPIKRSLLTADYKVEIKSRSKSISSIYEKMQLKKLHFEEIYDIFAVRIILNVPLEIETRSCWEAYTIVTSHYRPKPGRLRDWISTPKSNNYQALHTTVMSQFGRWVEVQIRSTRMDEIAEKGYAAHWKYKTKHPALISNVDNWINRLRDMLETVNASDDPNVLDDFLDNLLGYLFTDEIFVFTSKGEKRILPNHSTVLDFAYAIHSEVGNTCIGAEVNHKLKPITYMLQSGDQINILTSKAHKPQSEWLDYVITSRARFAINAALKEQKKQYINEGETKLEKMFAEADLEWSKENRKTILALSGKTSLNDLYFEVVSGTFSTQELKACLQHKSSNWLKKINPFNRSRSSMQEIVIKNVQLLGKTEKTLHKDCIIATCCHPIPGDDIIAVTSKHNIPMIHRANCKQVSDMDSSKDAFIIKTRWNENTEQTFLTGIYLEGFDKKGFIYELSDTLFRQLHINIKSFDIEANEGICYCRIMLFVLHLKQLNFIINHLKKITFIERVFRIDNKDNINNNLKPSSLV